MEKRQLKQKRRHQHYRDCVSRVKSRSGSESESESESWSGFQDNDNVYEDKADNQPSQTPETKTPFNERQLKPTRRLVNQTC
jgi:hypothetical protein